MKSPTMAYIGFRAFVLSLLLGTPLCQDDEDQQSELFSDTHLLNDDQSTSRSSIGRDDWSLKLTTPMSLEGENQAFVPNRTPLKNKDPRGNDGPLTTPRRSTMTPKDENQIYLISQLPFNRKYSPTTTGERVHKYLSKRSISHETADPLLTQRWPTGPPDDDEDEASSPRKPPLKRKYTSARPTQKKSTDSRAYIIAEIKKILQMKD